jgi:hypothetical protein
MEEMDNVSKISNSELLRDEAKKLTHKCEYYRNKSKEKGQFIYKSNKVLKFTSGFISILVLFSALLALNGVITLELFRTIGLSGSTITALLQLVLYQFFDSGDMVKLYHASGEFLDTKHKISKLLSESRTSRKFNVEEYSLIYPKVNSLRKNEKIESVVKL